MQEFDILAFNDFVTTTLNETMTDSDYTLVMSELGFPLPRSGNPAMYKSGCHNLDFSKAKYNLAYYSETRSFYCFSECNRNLNLLDLVKTRFDLMGEPKTIFNSMKWICKVCDIPFSFSNNETKQIEYDWKKDLGKYRKNNKKVDNQDIIIYDDRVLKNFSKLYSQEWLDYGISKETMDKFEVGYYLHKNCITIPCRDKLGRLLGIRTRLMNKLALAKGSPRYMPLNLLDGTIYKFATNKMLYGEYQNEQNIRKSKMALLVESEKSVLKLDTLMNGKGFALGMMGSTLSDENVRYILSLGVNKVCICIDNDFYEVGDEHFELFKKKVNKMASKFTPFVKVEVVFNNIGIKDMYKASPFDFTVKQFRQMWVNRIKMN